VPNFYKHLITGWTWSTNSKEWLNPHTFNSVCRTVNVFTYTAMGWKDVSWQYNMLSSKSIFIRAFYYSLYCINKTI